MKHLVDNSLAGKLTKEYSWQFLAVHLVRLPRRSTDK